MFAAIVKPVSVDGAVEEVVVVCNGIDDTSILDCGVEVDVVAVGSDVAPPPLPPPANFNDIEFGSIIFNTF